MKPWERRLRIEVAQIDPDPEAGDMESLPTLHESACMAVAEIDRLQARLERFEELARRAQPLAYLRPWTAEERHQGQSLVDHLAEYQRIVSSSSPSPSCRLGQRAGEGE